MAKNIMDLLKGISEEEDLQIPMRPADQMPEVEEAALAAQNAQINEEAKSPNMMTKPELAGQQMQQEAQKTVPGQLQERAIASGVANPVSKVTKAEEGGDSTLKDLKANIEKYKARMNKKEESSWTDSLPDIMAGLHNTLNYAQGSQQKMLGTDNKAKQDNSKAAAKKEDLSQITGLQKLYDGYINQQNKQQNQIAAQKENEANRELKERLASAKKAKNPTEFDKALAKKQAADFANSQEGLQKTATALDKVDQALNAQLNYSRENIGGTGPIATLGGMTKYFSSDTEGLEAKFKEIDLKNMVSTFSGMSKAVDSDAERRAWKATQASVSNDDKTNVQILLGSKSSLLKDKAVAEAKANHVKQYGDLEGFTHPILEGKITTLVAPSGEMKLVDKSKIKELKQGGYRTVDEQANMLLKNESPKNETVIMVSPDGEERPVRADMVQKYIDKGARIKE